MKYAVSLLCLGIILTGWQNLIQEEYHPLSRRLETGCKLAVVWTGRLPNLTSMLPRRKDILRMPVEVEIVHTPAEAEVWLAGKARLRHLIRTTAAFSGIIPSCSVLAGIIQPGIVISRRRRYGPPKRLEGEKVGPPYHGKGIKWDDGNRRRHGNGN